MLAPGLALLALAFFVPVAQLLWLGFLVDHTPAGDTLTLKHYLRFFTDGYFLGVSERTLRLSLIITAITAALGVPIAYVMARVGPRWRLWLILLTIVPLMTSVVVRTFGWLVILGRGGLLATVLSGLGITNRNFTLMHTEWGVVIAQVQVLLPFMTLTLLGALDRIDPRLEEAARTNGASFARTLRHVTLPLALPGIVSGSLLVFALSASSFITPALVGGVRLPVLAGSIYQQTTTTLDWSFAAAQSTILLVAVLAITLPYIALAGRRHG